MNKLKVIGARAKRKTWKRALGWVDAIFHTDHYWQYTFRINGYHQNDYRFKKHQIAFVHVPKTGGTSLCSMLLNQPQTRVVNLKVHRPVSRFCPPDRFLYLTIIRDPVDRVWSQYQMVLREKGNYPYKKYALEGLPSFLRNCWAVQNMYCRYYSGKVGEKINEVTCEEACSNLQHFFRVLSFDDFANQVSAFLSEEKIPFHALAHERKSSYPEPTAAERTLIRSYNRYDLQLYRQWQSGKK